VNALRPGLLGDEQAAAPTPPDDAGTFEDFYRSHRASVLRAVVAATGDLYDAEDCTAEAFARCLRQWDRVRDHPAPDAWVVRTAINHHHDRARRGRRALRLLPQLVDTESSPPPEPPIDPTLLAALKSLPERQRQVVALRIILGLSGEQTAAELDISSSTVGVHLHRALAALRPVVMHSEDHS
jgi:RNA polymerase sigma factor (sigma-70 family)